MDVSRWKEAGGRGGNALYIHIRGEGRPKRGERGGGEGVTRSGVQSAS